MLYNYTLQEIESNTNTGIEYEIALFHQLLYINPSEQTAVMSAINKRQDSQRIKNIISFTNTNKITAELSRMGCRYIDVSFETQNDEVGPSDIVLYIENQQGDKYPIGLSVKYDNTCTLNVTGRKFITNTQIVNLKQRYKAIYVSEFIQEMADRFGNAYNWHRKPSTTTDKFIDEIRDAVISNWPNVANKTELLKNCFHDDSPIAFWVVTYTKNNYNLKTTPSTIDMSRANDVSVKKYLTSYVAFYLENMMIGRMQVKFNNGFIEYNFNHKGERKKKTPDLTIDGIEFVYGKPFSSWNFSVED